MKKNILLLSAVVSLLISQPKLCRAQIDTAYLQGIITSFDTSGWVHFDQDSFIAPNTIIPLFMSWVSPLGANDQFYLIEDFESEASSIPDFHHYKYQQYHFNIPVEGAIVMEHAVEGGVIAINGHYADSIMDFNEVVITLDSAVSIALNDPATDGELGSPLWLDSLYEIDIQEAKGDPLASYYPTEDLLWALNNSDSLNYHIPGYKYRLCYKMHIYRFGLIDSSIQAYAYYVDANNGEIWRSTPLRKHYQGEALVRHYAGSRSFTVRERGLPNWDYVLQDEIRNLHTKDMHNEHAFSITAEVTDNDGNWWADDQMATTAHYYVSTAWNYYSLIFNRQGWDDHSNKIRIYANYADNLTSTDGKVNDDMWFGYLGSDYIGSLDVTGHEYTHGVISRTARFADNGEPTIVEEGLCDIFGTMVEAFHDGSISNWTLNEDDGFISRNIADPMSMDMPNRYHGDNWCPQNQFCSNIHDYGHHNSSVVSHWFYLASQGKSGGFAGIGTTKVAKISYLAMTEVLTPLTFLVGLRDATINVAVWEYGYCSVEHIALALAWEEVGLGIQLPCGSLSHNITAKPDEIKVYPNPTTGEILFIGLAEGYEVRILNIMGQEMVSYRCLGSEISRFDISNLSSGSYVIIIIDEQGNLVKREKLSKI